MSNKIRNIFNTFSILLKKYYYVFVLVFLTVLLMIIFKYNKKEIDTLIENSKRSLLALYTQNMKPLLATSDITNEDVFNFALYQKLPIDSEKKKVLYVSHNDFGEQVYEVQPAEFVTSTNNYENFKNYLGLSHTDKLKADSILNIFKDEIHFSILTNDKNTVAVNPKLLELQNSLLTEIITLAERADYNKVYDILPNLRLEVDKDKTEKHLSSVTAQVSSEDFIFITPDTVFKKEINFDLPKELKVGKSNWMTKDDKDVKIDIVWDKENIKNITNENELTIKYSLHFDSSIVKVVVPKITAPPKPSFSYQDSVRKKMEEFKRSSSKYSTDSKTKTGYTNNKVSRKTRNDNMPLNFSYFFKNPSGVEKYTNELLSKIDYKSLEEFARKMDSLGKAFKFDFKDSLSIKNKLYEKYSNKKRSLK